MPTLQDFRNNPELFASTQALLLSEPAGLLNPPLTIGINHTIAPQNLHFQFSNLGTTPQTTYCNIIGAASANSEPCYFLPYQDDTSVTTTIGTAHRFFFTSQLTGCTVQVSGPAHSPTITHANAKTVFKNAAGGLQAATLAAQTAITGMMPPPVAGSTAASVTRMTMEAAFTPGNIASAKQSYGINQGYRLKEFNPGMVSTHGASRPELGMVVFGVQDPAGWKFYSSVTVSVTGRQKKGHTYCGFHFGVDNKSIADSITLGPSNRFWP